MSDLPARFLAGVRGAEGLALAVSGGGDSMAMLHLAVAAGLRPAVVTVDHGLRAGSAAEAAMVAEVAARLGLNHTTLHWRDWDGTGNLQDAARKARRRLMAAWARSQGLASLALAHTSDDIAETFLMRLARGAGVDGLAAMSPHWSEQGVLWQRPLLGFSRAGLRTWLHASGHGWVEDPSNDNLRFDRVKARKALRGLGALDLTASRLAQVANHLAEARKALDALADDWAARTLTEAGGTVRIAATLWSAPAETQRRLLQRIILWIAPAEYAPRGTQIGQLLARLAAGQAATLAGCRFSPTATGATALREAARIGPRVDAGQVWDGRWQITGNLPSGVQIGALGRAGLSQCPAWRDIGLPGPALLVSPAIWLEERLVAAPLAGFHAHSHGAKLLLPLFERNSAVISH